MSPIHQIFHEPILKRNIFHVADLTDSTRSTRTASAGELTLPTRGTGSAHHISRNLLEAWWPGESARNGNGQGPTIKGKVGPKTAKLANAGKDGDDADEQYRNSVASFAHRMFNLRVDPKVLDTQ